MTSAAKDNQRRVVELCKQHGWFGRGRSSFRLFEQVCGPRVSSRGCHVCWAVLDAYGHPSVHLWRPLKLKRVVGIMRILRYGRVIILGRIAVMSWVPVPRLEETIYTNIPGFLPANADDLARSAKSKGQVPCFGLSVFDFYNSPEFWFSRILGWLRHTPRLIFEWASESQLGRFHLVEVEDWPGKPRSVFSSRP
jgi:hypothetical protein